MPTNFCVRVRLGLLGGGALLMAGQAAAAPAAAPEAVTVAARKRVEAARHVPLSVTVISGAVAARNNLNNLQDVLAEVPEAEFRTNSTNNQRTLFIRGIGTISTSPGVEPSVSTVVDGVVLGRSGQAVLDLVDVQQIEILAGPQGTLFGKNASAGVVNITTAAPQGAFHAWTEGDYFGGAGNEYRLSGGVTGSLAPPVSANLSFLADDWDGNVHNDFNDATVNGYAREGARSKILYEPSDDFSATLALDYMHAFDSVPTGVYVTGGRLAYPSGLEVPNKTLATLLAAQGIVPGPDNTTLNNNVNGNETDDNGGTALTLAKALGDFELTSITAWRIWNNVHVADYDETSAPPKAEPQQLDFGTLLYNQWSQELRLASPKGGLVDYVVGAYFLKAVENETYDRDYAPAKSPYRVTVNEFTNYGTESDNEALFGEANINVTQDLRFIAGLRVIRDGLSFHMARDTDSATPVSGIRPSFAATGSDEHYDYTDRLGVQWDFSPDAMAYFTYARGYQSPAYNVFLNMQATDTPVLQPETNNSFEVGMKASLFGGQAQADIAGFIEDFSNYQVNFNDLVNGAVVQRLINAGTVSSSGVQASLRADPAAGLHIGVHALYDDAHIDQFNCPSNASASCDVNGQPLPFAPRYKVSADAGYTVPLNYTFQLQGTSVYTWQSKTQYQLTETPDTVQQAYGIWDAALNLLNGPQQWRASLVVKNITDQHYSSFLAPGNIAGLVRFVPRDASRYFGVEVRKDF